MTSQPKAFCSVEGCDGTSSRKGLCIKHFGRLQRNGSPLKMKGAGSNEARDWIASALRFEGEECLFWPFPSVHKRKRPTTTHKGKSLFVARYVCVMTNGEPSAPSLQAAHECGNTSCCNPKHLSWKTPKENTNDKYRHGTMLSGERHPLAKLTEQQASFIKNYRGPKTRNQLAADFGVSLSAVAFIRDGRHWRHVS